MKSFLREMEEKFIEIESTNSVDHLEEEETVDEQNVTAAVAGFNTPAAFAKPGKWKSKKATYESINTPPSFRWKDETPQRPESDEEVFNDKFPFAITDEYWWQNDNNEYPTKFYADGMGTNSIKDKTTQIGNLPNTSTPHRKPKNEYIQVQEAMDRKYEQLIESYKTFATGDSKTTPEQKVKNTIKEVAKKLQEIETLVNHTSRLKTESGLSRSGIGPAADKALTKISERLIKISERVRTLGE